MCGKRVKYGRSVQETATSNYQDIDGRKIGFAGYERQLSGGMEPALAQQPGAVDLPFKAASSAAT